LEENFCKDECFEEAVPHADLPKKGLSKFLHLPRALPEPLLFADAYWYQNRTDLSGPAHSK
jgi:hypothetical protein